MTPAPPLLTPRHLFEVVLAHGLAARGSRQSLPPLVATFRIAGELGGTWSVHCADGAGAVVPAAAQAPELVVTTSDATLMALARGELRPEVALTSGQMEIAGKPDALARLADLFATDWNLWEQV